jgi:hypothetical protein
VHTLCRKLSECRLGIAWTLKRRISANRFAHRRRRCRPRYGWYRLGWQRQPIASKPEIKWGRNAQAVADGGRRAVGPLEAAAPRRRGFVQWSNFEPTTYYKGQRLAGGGDRQGDSDISTIQAIALGAMVCTPSLIFLTWVLWKTPPSWSYDEDTSSHPMGDRVTAEILSRWSDVTGKTIDPNAGAPAEKCCGTKIGA